MVIPFHPNPSMLQVFYLYFCFGWLINKNDTFYSNHMVWDSFHLHHYKCWSIWKQQFGASDNILNGHTPMYNNTLRHRAPSSPPQTLILHILLANGTRCNNILCCKLWIFFTPYLLQPTLLKIDSQWYGLLILAVLLLPSNKSKNNTACNMFLGLATMEKCISTLTSYAQYHFKNLAWHFPFLLKLDVQP